MTVLPITASFPDCHDCPCFRSGPGEVCLRCAGAQIAVPTAAACPLCAQRLGDAGRCPNELCRNPRRRIGKIHAIGYQEGALRRAIRAYKYGGVRSWSTIFGRLLLAWLEQNMAGTPPGLIAANPTYTRTESANAASEFDTSGGSGFAHTEAVLRAAAAEDAENRWPFDTGTPPALEKTRPTLKSSDGQESAKRLSGNDLRSALHIPDPSRTRGKLIVVYDDVCTTGAQLDAVAGCLLDEGGAASVEGIVLARAPWRGR